MAKNQFFLKLKEDKGARAIAVTIVAMLLVLTAIILTTVIANRATDAPLPPDEQVGVQDPDGDTAPDNGQNGGENPPEQNDGNTPPTESTDALPSQFLLPVSGVLQKPHDAAQQVFSPTMGDYRVHLGIDIGTVAGASVSAMADGVIAQVWEDFAMGQCVAIKHGGDAYTIYKNLAPTLAESCVVGKQVRAGDVIGTVGESAANEVAEEPHLHLEMTVGGLQVNPYDYLDEQARATLNEDVNYEDAS
jgi:murein DD-endopeptidase MepM/ murein hydrolase activator NlpD